MSKLNLCVLFGGASSEHEISLLSARSVLENLDCEKYNILHIGITRSGAWYYCPDFSPDELKDGAWETRRELHSATLSASRGANGLILIDTGERLSVDCIFPVLHGENGEDGRMQGLFELAGIPFVGPGAEASAIAMDKSVTKLVAATTGVRQADWMLVTDKSFHDETLISRLEAKFEYPMFIKPAGTGSSVGTSKAKTREELSKGICDALRYGGRALVEEFIDGYEIETAVLGNDEPEVSCCGQIIPSSEFYSYESKYIDARSQTVIPARIPEEVCEKVRRIAREIYYAIGCKGLSRVDFFVTRDKHEVVFNEINTIPGFTSISMYAKLFAASGIGFSELLDRLIALAA